MTFSSAETIRHKLLASELKPSLVEVIDESYKHQGHAGYSGPTGSHFQVRIISDAFKGLPRIKRHQAVYRILQHEMQTHIHALAIQALDPGES